MSPCILSLFHFVTCLARSEAEPAENDLIKARQESELLHRSLNGKELPEQPVGAAVAEEASRSPGPAPHSSRQHDHPNLHQDSSSPLLQVNFWLTLLISALAAALLS
uniref:Putative conserved secreted protein n=1 Tax=Ixodes ricinus TaxID=34613 RepID=A0A6B0UIM8_IXORI